MKDLIVNLEQAIFQASMTECPVLLGELERLKGLAWVKLIQGKPTASAPNSLSDCGRYLTVKELVERFHVSSKWLYRHKRQMPHSQPSRKVLLFPEQAVTKWFASRKQA